MKAAKYITRLSPEIDRLVYVPRWSIERMRSVFHNEKRLLFPRLQSKHRVWRFDRSLPPPLEKGVMWSTSSDTSGGFLPQQTHWDESRLRTSILTLSVILRVRVVFFSGDWSGWSSDFLDCELRVEVMRSRMKPLTNLCRSLGFSLGITIFHLRDRV